MIGKMPSSWPLTARVPVIAGVMIFVVSVAVAHVVMAWFFRQQEQGLERLSAIYLDGLSATILPYVASNDREATLQALDRTLLFHQGIRERRLIVLTPDGDLFAEAALDSETKQPQLDTDLLQRLADNRGLVLDLAEATGWVHRALERHGRLIAHVFAQLDVSELRAQRRQFRLTVILAVLLASAAAALLGSSVIRRVVAPLHLITERLKRAQAGSIEPLPEAEVATSSTELRELVGGFNALAAALEEREALAHRLAERERNAVLGRLAAAIAHEVRNPLAGMLGAVDTIRKFGADEEIRRRSVSLLERGLDSIGDVVGATLATYRMPFSQRRLSAQDFDDLRVLAELEARRRQLALLWSSAVDRELAIPATELRQIVLNLLLNACAATPPHGTIAFSATLDDDHALRLVVEDEGPGMPDTVAGALLGDERQSAADGDASRAGIGILVVRGLIRELDGRVSIEPRAGGGTRVVLRVPAADTEVAHAAE
jgi:two-component system, OmpR family, sensor kinase